MDRYNERLVPGRPGSEARLVFGVGIVLILAAVGLVAAGFAVKPIIALGSLPAVVLGVYIIIYSRQLFQVEFEYLLVNGDIEVSKIIAKKRRKVVREIRVEDITRMAPLSNDRVKNDISRVEKRQVFDYTAGTETAEESGAYYVVVEKVKNVESFYILDLNDDCRQHMKEVLKSRFEK